MGLFSKKKESHTIEEAYTLKDEKFSYTCESGRSYEDFPFLMGERLYQNISAADFDDAFEMYAPKFMNTINNISQCVQELVKQNQLLQMKCDRLEHEFSLLKNSTHREL